MFGTYGVCKGRNLNRVTGSQLAVQTIVQPAPLFYIRIFQKYQNFKNRRLLRYHSQVSISVVSFEGPPTFIISRLIRQGVLTRIQSITVIQNTILICEINFLLKFHLLLFSLCMNKLYTCICMQVFLLLKRISYLFIYLGRICFRILQT